MEKQFVDLHMHSKFSDGTDSIEALLAALRKANITAFSVTDHDTVAFYEHLEPHQTEGLRMIPGIELSCISKAGKCHILGYGIDVTHQALKNMVAEAAALRKAKLELRLCHLKDRYGIVLNEEENAYLSSLSSVGKPHLALILIKRGLAENVGEAIQKYLTGLPKAKDRLDAKIAIEAILQSGGIPVWAHPLGGENEPRLAEDAFEKQLQTLLSFGIRGLECYYSRYTEDEIHFLLENARKHSLFVSGGSDYHGMVKNIPIGTLKKSDSSPGYCKEEVLAELLNAASENRC